MAPTPSDRNQSDRNQNVKQQLLKKRDQQAEARKALAAGELVDDALARGTASFLKWLKANSKNLQAGVVVLALLGVGYAAYHHLQVKKAQAATHALCKAQRSDQAKIESAEPAAESEPSEQSVATYKSGEERRAAALSGYRTVTGEYAGSGQAILARLGEAGVLLDKGDFDAALAAYRDVKASKLAPADTSVRVRCVEGIGLALEAKKDIDGALASFRELENTDVRGYKELGQYQQARVLASRGDEAKGDVPKATELLKAAREKLRKATVQTAFGERPLYPYLQMQVDDLLGELDPSAARAGGTGHGLSPEQLQRLQEQLRRRAAETQKTESE